MVFCGKPSKACDSCRARRIKCDLRKPACTQCTKISKTCPGYRDQLDLCFRDESASVVQKVQKQQRKRESSSQSNSPSPEKEVLSQWSSTSLVEVDPFMQQELFSSMEMAFVISTWTPTFPIEEVARCHFMESFIQGSHFDYLPELYKTTLSGGLLMAAINANACANLFRESGDSALLEKAQRYYVQALTQTNAAIKSPEEAPLDTTLTSVLLLGLYETLTQDYRDCPKSFAAHNQGAAALLKLRGTHQLKSELGKRIYSQVSMNLRVSCAQRETSLPSDFLDFQEEAMPFLDQDDPLVRFFFLIDAFNQMRMNARNEIATGIYTTSSIETALQLDQKLVAIMEGTSPAFRFKEIRIDHDDPAVLGNVYHKYPDHRVAQRWNAMRMMRLLFNEHAYDHMNRITLSGNIDSGTTTYLLQELAARNVEEMAREICASVPQFCEIPPNGLLPVTPAAFLLWPLAMAGRNALCTAEIHDYAMERLRFLGVEARLPQGVWAAEMLGEDRSEEDWLHLSHLA